jgi:hypothetical protein
LGPGEVAEGVAAGETRPDTALVNDDTASVWGTSDEATFCKLSWTTARDLAARVGLTGLPVDDWTTTDLTDDGPTIDFTQAA